MNALPPAETIRVLVIDDSADEVATLSYELGQHLPQCQTRWVETAEQMYAQIQAWQPHILLSDVRVPRYDVFAALAHLAEHWPLLPVVVVSGQVGEEVAARLIRAGARDFVSKTGAARLARVIERELADARSRAEKAELAGRLLGQERLFELVLENLPVGVWLLDESGAPRHGNPAGRAIWHGAHEADDGGRRRHGVWHADTGEPIAAEQWASTRAIRFGETSLEQRVEIETTDGQRKVILDSAVPLRDVAGQRVGTLVVNQDITAQHRTEQRLRQAEQTLRRLSLHLLDVQEQERRWIAQELHDDIGQAIAAMRFQLARIVEHSDPAQAGALAAQALAASDQLNTRLRQICLGLRPHELDDFGLLAALRGLINSLGSRPGLDITFDCEGQELRYTSAVETAAFRIAQEAITNALRHGASHLIAVYARLQADGLELTVTDDGTGFVVGDATDAGMRAEHLGLTGMLERARSVGGVLEIESEPGTGTLVRARLPGVAVASDFNTAPSPPDRT